MSSSMRVVDDQFLAQHESGCASGSQVMHASISSKNGSIAGQEASFAALSLKEKQATDELAKTVVIDNDLTWLKKFLESRQSDASVTSVIAKMKTAIAAERRPLSQDFVDAEKSIKVFEQIEKKKNFEDSQLTLQEILQHARFIVVEIPKAANRGREIFKKAETKLSRTIQCDPQTETAYLLANHKLNRNVPSGTYKRFAAAIGLSLKSLEKTFVVGRCFTKILPGCAYTGDIKKIEAVVNKIIEAVASEFRLGFKFAGLTGIVPVYAIAKYTVEYTRRRPRVAAQAPRVSALCKIFTGGSLESVAKIPSSMTLSQKLQVLKYVVYGLANLHALSFLHGDVKPGNVYFGITDSQAGTVEAAVGDLGFTSIFVNGKPVVCDAAMNQGYYNQGFYGSISYTAPELFGVANFAGDHEKVEAFAMSVMMEQLIADENPPFVRIIDRCYEDNFQRLSRKFASKAALVADREAVYSSVKATRDCLIEPLEKEIQAGKRLSEEGIYNYMMYRLGHSDPAKRLNFREAKVLFDTFLPDIEPKGMTFTVL